MKLKFKLIVTYGISLLVFTGLAYIDYKTVSLASLWSIDGLLFISIGALLATGICAIPLSIYQRLQQRYK